MAHRSWDIYVDGRKHRVELEHAYWSGRLVIRVDGATAQEAEELVDEGGHHPIQIGSHEGFVRITTNGFTFRYDLIMAGHSVATGKPVALDAPTYPCFGERAPKWTGAHLPKWLDHLLAGGLLTLFNGALHLLFPVPRHQVLGVLLLLAGGAAFLVRRPEMMVVIGVFLLLVGLGLVAAYAAYPKVWGLAAFSLAPGIWLLRDYRTYRKAS